MILLIALLANMNQVEAAIRDGALTENDIEWCHEVNSQYKAAGLKWFLENYHHSIEARVCANLYEDPIWEYQGDDRIQKLVERSKYYVELEIKESKEEAESGEIDPTPAKSSEDKSNSTTTLPVGWQMFEAMPTARTEVVAVAIGDKIYVVGGFDKDGRAVNVVEVFDTANNSWVTVAPMPQALHHVGATTHEGKLYVVGGYKDGWIATNSLFIYDPATNQWKKGKEMPTARGALTAQFIDHTLYAVGGADHIVFPVNEAYDHVDDKWETRASMPTPREHLASAVIDGKMYAIGGRQGSLSSNLDSNEVYDPSSNIWSALDPMPTARGGLTATVLNETILVFGGESNSGTFEENEQYIPQQGWYTQLPMPTPRHGLGSATVGDRIYVIGGGLTPGLSVSDVNEAYTIPEFPIVLLILIISIVILITKQRIQEQILRNSNIP